jgi:hypothetical protein
MRHEPFLKMISQELKAGRMVDVSSVSICRCGRRFATDEELEAHISRPITSLLEPVEESMPEPESTPEAQPAPALIAAVQGAGD